jgi:hypothetical protein
LLLQATLPGRSSWTTASDSAAAAAQQQREQACVLAATQQTGAAAAAAAEEMKHTVAEVPGHSSCSTANEQQQDDAGECASEEQAATQTPQRVLRKRPATGGSSNAPAPEGKRQKTREGLPLVELTGGVVCVSSMVSSYCRTNLRVCNANGTASECGAACINNLIEALARRGSVSFYVQCAGSEDL